MFLFISYIVVGSVGFFMGLLFGRKNKKIADVVANGIDKVLD